jgi:excisionase family DNA binding protein
MLEMAPDLSDDLETALNRPFYSPAEVAELAGVSTSTVHNYIHDGRLASVRLSERVIRIPRRAILRLLAPDSVSPPERVRLDQIPLQSG